MGMHPLAKLDHAYVWHPFTQMRDWLKCEPIVIIEGKGAVLWDAHGKAYLDANSSIWTNLHGHNHPKINAAIERQLRKVAHSSALGLANEPASRLAQRLVQLANPHLAGFASTRSSAACSGDRAVSAVHGQGGVLREGGGAHVASLQAGAIAPYLAKVFFSDDGSTAMEVALKLAYEFARRTGRSTRPRFLSLQSAYHGDTIGAVSLGHIDLFHKSYAGLLFGSDAAMSPYCYRCPFNRSAPERADARAYRRCNWECIDKVEQKFARAKRRGHPYAGFIFEPLIQGAAGMIPQPAAWLRRVAEIARSYNALLVADEVMTGFGRAGAGGLEAGTSGFGLLLACHQEGVQPDFLALAKGMTGGYLPMAATLTTRDVFDAFLGGYEEFKTFFHGHSYTGNQLGSAAALASLDLLESRACIRDRRVLEETLREELKSLWAVPTVGDIRQVGLIAGVELVRNWRTREAFESRERAGMRVCEGMVRRGVLTRPIGNVVVLMPPYCTTKSQARRMVTALYEACDETLRA
jgi:adenosylmethionine-8-amino-7-oxononanoate aminotransferase